MHVLYIHQYFRTPEEGGGIRSYYLAKGLADAGHQVDLLTAYDGSYYKKAFVDGIHVHYLPVPYRQSFGIYQRIKAFLRFVLLAVIKAGELRQADCCYISSTPLTTGLIGLYLKWRYAVPYYFEVRDLRPEAPVQMGVVRRKWLKKQLYALEKRIYRIARAVIALSPGAQQYISSLAPNQPVVLIPNMADCNFFRKASKNSYHEQQFDVQDRFVVTYFGAIGRVNQLENILRAAAACQQQGLHEVIFLIVGQGSELYHIQRLARERSLGNVRFVPFQNKYGLLSVLNVTDAAYISFAALPVLRHGSPNKLFDALAAGKLCITTVTGWIQEMLESKQCGFYTDPEQPEDFVRQIAPFVNDRRLLDDYQTRARLLAEQEFERKQQLVKLLTLVDEEYASAKADTLTV